MEWSSSLSEAGLLSHLSKRSGEHTSDNWRAAVLVPFVRESDGWHLLFIRRAERFGDAHSGQVAFPGGMVEQVDNGPVGCALREAHEEIGLAAQSVTVVGCLPSQRALKGFDVQPVTAISRWPVNLCADPTEVAHWFTVPIEWLADPSNHEALHYLDHEGRERRSSAFREYRGERVWGLTARIVFDVLNLA